MGRIFYYIKRLWLSFSKILGKINTVILLSLIYYIVIGCMSLVVKVLRKDLLQKKIDSKRNTYWIDRQSIDATIERNKFQF